MRGGIWTVSFVVLAATVGVAAADEAAKPTTATSPATPSLESLVERLRKSVAVITFAGRDGSQQGLGSGFVISPRD